MEWSEATCSERGEVRGGGRVENEGEWVASEECAAAVHRRRARSRPILFCTSIYLRPLSATGRDRPSVASMPASVRRPASEAASEGRRLPVPLRTADVYCSSAIQFTPRHSTLYSPPSILRTQHWDEMDKNR